MRALVGLLVVVLGSSQARAEAPARPPASAGQVLGEVALGAAATVAGGFGGLLVANQLCHSDDDEGCLGPLILGLYIGGGLGFGAGVFLGGSFGDQTGSLVDTMVGTSVGVALGTVVLLGIEQSSSERTVLGGLAVAAIAPVVGALISFDRSRRWKAGRGPAIGSLIHVDADRVSLGIPFVTQDVRGGTSMSLLSGRF